jgi:hypothetical protein
MFITFRFRQGWEFKARKIQVQSFSTGCKYAIVDHPRDQKKKLSFYNISVTFNRNLLQNFGNQIIIRELNISYTVTKLNTTIQIRVETKIFVFAFSLRKLTKVAEMFAIMQNLLLSTHILLFWAHSGSHFFNNVKMPPLVNMIQSSHSPSGPHH